MYYIDKIKDIEQELIKLRQSIYGDNLFAGNLHTHTNKDVLDILTITKINIWDANSHTHSNKAYLDTIAGNTLVASLNADMLDGLHSDAFLQKGINNVNNQFELIKSYNNRIGFNLYGRTLSGFYTDGWLILTGLNTVIGANYYHDGSERFLSNESPAIVLRLYKGNLQVFKSTNTPVAGNTVSWAGPYTVWHSGNDGNGSGLDADMLDGKHASDFVAKTGDTMTNVLAITKSGITTTAVYGFVPFTSGNKYNAVYRKLATLPISNGDNYACLQISGFISGWRSTQGKASIDIVISNRDTLVFAGGYHGILGSCDIVVYQNTDNTMSVYAKFNGGTWCAEWSLDMKGTQVTWDYITSTETTTAPSGTLIKSLSNDLGQIWHSNNDGSGSGLDADLLDGLHSDAFLQKGINNVNNQFELIKSYNNRIGFNLHGTAISGVQADWWLHLTGLYTEIGANYYSDGIRRFLSNESPATFLRLSQGNLQVYKSTNTPVAGNTISWAGPYTVWHSGNDGNGSGLDADLLDGLDSSRFHRSALSVFTGGDWNTLTSHGVYKIQHANFASDTNNPPANYPYGILNVLVSEIGGENRILQIYYPHGNDNYIYLRMYNGGGWTGWRKIWANGTGSGSGLDADLLDGYHASSFPRLDTVNTFTKQNIFTELIDAIGNIRTSGYIYHSSTDYVSQGFKLEASKQWFSKIEAENLFVKRFTTELEQIYAGLLTVGESAGKTTVAQPIEWHIKRIAMLDGTTSAQFAVDDIIMFQYYNRSGGGITVLREYFRVTGVESNTANGFTDYTVTRLTNNITDGTSIPAGSVVIKVANYNGSISSNVTLDAIKGSIDISTVRWNNGFTKDIIFKAGDLAGLVFNGTALTGKGIYIAGNAYFEGIVNATGGKIAGWGINSNSINADNVYLENTSGFKGLKIINDTYPVVSVGVFEMFQDVERYSSLFGTYPLFADNDNDLIPDNWSCNYHTTYPKETLFAKGINNRIYLKTFYNNQGNNGGYAYYSTEVNDISAYKGRTVKIDLNCSIIGDDSKLSRNIVFSISYNSPKYGSKYYSADLGGVQNITQKSIYVYFPPDTQYIIINWLCYGASMNGHVKEYDFYIGFIGAVNSKPQIQITNNGIKIYKSAIENLEFGAKTIINVPVLEVKQDLMVGDWRFCEEVTGQVTRTSNLNLYFNNQFVATLASKQL